MRIGLITDTHIPEVARELPPKVAEVFRGVDLILHSGDIFSLSVLDELESVAPVLAALGDGDHFSLIKDHRVKTKHVLDLEGHTVWLVHEKPLMRKLTPPEGEQTPDIIVHGHSHVAAVYDNDGILFVGSGSPTLLHYQRGPGTAAILEITSQGAEASIVSL